MQQPPEGNYQQPSQPPYPPQQPYSEYPPQQPYPPQYTPPPGYPPQQPGYPPQQPYYPQQPPMQPPKKKSKAGLFVGIGVFLVVLFICVGAMSHGDNSSPSTTTTTTNSVSNTSQSQPTQAPTQAPAKSQTWTTTQKFSGNGEKKTAVFSVPDDWKIEWTCNPSSFMGGTYNVIVTVYNSDGTLSDLAINSMCKNGTTSGETEEHQAGNIYLDVASEGDWTVTVQELK